MSPSDEQLNEQAVGVASTVLSDTVVAATRCEQTTMDQVAKAAGVGGATRGMARFSKKLGEAMMPSVGNMAKGLEGGGLPKTFILAVTADKVAAIEDKQKDDQLVGGKVLKEWPREGFVAKLDNGPMGAMTGVPEDRQLLILYLPLDGSSNKYLAAANKNMAAAGSPGMPTKFMIAKDAPSDAVAKELAGSSPPPTVIMGGQVVQGGMAGMPGMPGAGGQDSTAQLEKLAALHASGALTDAEFEAQKAKVLGG